MDADNTLILDAATLSNANFTLQIGALRVGALELSDTGPVPGWLRRLSPPDWQRGVSLESHESAVKAAWLALIVAITRTCGVSWLTELDALVAAENKITQMTVARQLGVPVPETIVTNDTNALAAAFPDGFVIKPLGPGHFYQGDKALVVYASVLRPDSPELAALGAAPFLVQRRLRALQHLRVVTVRDQVWAAALDADNWPLDWREASAAHKSFEPAVPPVEVAHGAAALTTSLKLGYSSQDWLVCRDGCYVVDINPAGQWLFLPEPIATSVSQAIAHWLNRDFK
jgi:glutathione synthase/RimK-type ligase-like ATP-grasp enzyme